MGSKSILVTGATGFIGSHVAQALRRLGHEVHCIVPPFEAQELLYQKVVSDAGANPIAGDLRDKFSLDTAMRISQPEVVMHCGALTSVAQSYNNPVAFAETNYIGTVNLVQSCLRNAPRLERFYYIATTEALKSRPEPHSETDYQYDANSPYGISKLAAELYVIHAYRAFGLPAVTIRYNNTFHRKTSRHYLIETVITQLEKGPRVVLKGSSKIKRTWTIIDDVVEGTLRLMENSKIGELYHICNPNNQATIAEVIETAAKHVFGYDEVEIVEGTQPRPYDPVCLCLTSERLEEIRWKPKYGLAEALRIVADFWKGKV